MFGNKSQPSRIYSYGARAPVEGLDLVETQMRLAHKYRNALVEQELERRKRVDQALRDLSPDLASTEAALKDAEEALAAAREAIDRASAQARKKVRPPDLMAAVKAARENRKALYGRRKALRTALFESPGWQAKQTEINDWSTERQKAIRSECGLYWGTYLHVEQSMGGCRSGAPPRFMRWDGDGHLAVQIQGGMKIEEAFGQDSRIRIEPLPTEGSKAARKRTRVMFRVGSDEGGGPVFATVQVVLHRPMPPDARIKWVHLIRRRIATHFQWRVQFVISREAGWDRPDSAPDGIVGIDVGWRIREDGSLRVAYWVGHDGREAELALPADWLGEMDRVERIRSHRDDNFNAARDGFVAWLKGTPADAIPAWLREATATLGQWRAAARLAALVIRWRGDRFPGDEKGFEALEAWRKRDKHLYEFEGNLRDQLQRRREDIYRNFAAKMRRAYRAAAVEDLDLRDFHELPQAEEPAAQGALREHTRDACLSLLLRCLKESMAETKKVPAPDTTKLCPKCGTVGEFPRESLVRTCPGCGDKDDQDRVAAINLLRAGMGTSAAVPQGA
jgi:Putative transposase DNA-binding domain